MGSVHRPLLGMIGTDCVLTTFPFFVCFTSCFSRTLGSITVIFLPVLPANCLRTRGSEFWTSIHGQIIPHRKRPARNKTTSSSSSRSPTEKVYFLNQWWRRCHALCLFFFFLAWQNGKMVTFMIMNTTESSGEPF